jgi:hypothetical protein
MSKTRKNGRGSATRGWQKEQPGYHEKIMMFQKCGRKCFLGPGKSFPICKKNTCKIKKKGVQSAYNRARQFHNKKVSQKAKRLLNKLK